MFVNVRNALIALTQYRAQVAAAEKAQDLAQRTLDSEQKKYQLGSSTSYLVVQRSRDLTLAQAQLYSSPRINLLVAEVAFNQAMGRTLEVNHIEMADAMRGKVSRTPNIPGALDADERARAPRIPGRRERSRTAESKIARGAALRTAPDPASCWLSPLAIE